MLDQYGNAAPRSHQKNRRLSSLHEARAQDMLLAKAQGNISIEEIANACNLSRSYFIRAFQGGAYSKTGLHSMWRRAKGAPA